MDLVEDVYRDGFDYYELAVQECEPVLVSTRGQ
jgi:hypothetical protein